MKKLTPELFEKILRIGQNDTSIYEELSSNLYDCESLTRLSNATKVLAIIATEDPVTEGILFGIEIGIRYSQMATEKLDN